MLLSRCGWVGVYRGFQSCYHGIMSANRQARTPTDGDDALPDDAMTYREAAEAIGRPVERVKAWVRQGRLRAWHRVRPSDNVLVALVSVAAARAVNESVSDLSPEARRARGRSNREAAIRRHRAGLAAIVEMVNAGEPLTNACKRAGVALTTVNHWRRNATGADPDVGWFVRDLEVALARAVAAKRERIAAEMHTVVGHVRKGATVQQACASAGVERFAPHRWIEGVADADDLCAWFRTEWPRAKAAGATRREAVNDAKLVAKATAKRSRDAWIYFIGSVDGTEPIKIGMTHDLARRLDTCQLHSPVKLAVLAATKAPRALEQWLHSALASDVSHREFFRRTPRVLACMEILAQTPNVTEAGEVVMQRLQAAARENHLFAAPKVERDPVLRASVKPARGARASS